MKYLSSLVALTAATAVVGAPENSRTRVRMGGPHNRNLAGDNGKIASRETEQPWGGAVQEGSNWYHATATVVVPSVNGQDPNSAASAWVGIDGYKCQNAILQTGLSFWGDGTVEPWYEWWPAWSYHYSQPFSAKAGDNVRMTVYAYSATAGNSTLENLTTGQVAHQQFSNQQSLCGYDAEWIVEDFGDSNGGHVPFADFGSITFRNTRADGNRGTVNAAGATIVNVEVDNEVHTSCGSNANGVLCKYV